MPEDEFEIYLTLLAKTLRLSDAQRDAIAAELRDHMEARLRELTLQGVEREDAIETALAEFGDASALANDLRGAASKTTTRRIVKTSIGTLAACCAIALLFTYTLPSQRAGIPQNASTLAQTPASDTDTAPRMGPDEYIVVDLRRLAAPATSPRYDLEKLARLQIEHKASALRLDSVNRELAIKEALRREGRVSPLEVGEFENESVLLQFTIQELEALIAYGSEQVDSSDAADVLRAIERVALGRFDPRRYELAQLRGDLIIRGDEEVFEAVSAFVKAYAAHLEAPDKAENE
ncbi:MAG: permease prefix domain 1-containing protein [Planctomycetota bacterium]